MKKSGVYIILIIALALLTSCSEREKIYKIGVSQCSGGLWRDKVNNEMLAAQHLYEQDVKVTIVCAFDNTQHRSLRLATWGFFIANLFQCTFFASFCIKIYTMEWGNHVILQQNH